MKDCEMSKIRYIEEYIDVIFYNIKSLNVKNVSMVYLHVKPKSHLMRKLYVEIFRRTHYYNGNNRQ